MDAYTEAYDASIRPLMNKIDRVRRFLTQNNDIIFPNVVVVGDQSSGKSTLLEALSSIELPKGIGIVTRCPLVLRLRNESERKLYRVYDGNNKVLLDEVNLNTAKYIEQETRKLAGNNKNIVEDFIELEIQDSHLRNLTVVDLPGIAHYATQDQPRNIHDQIINLIKKYIKQESCVILCVIPATVDIVIAKSMALAQDVDPKGKRTIGVITKSDLAPDHNVLVKQLLMNGHGIHHLKLGFVAVRNRSTDENISLQDAREREQAFFREHPIASDVDSNCLGMDALTSRLATLYSQCVKDTFPIMMNDIIKQLAEVDEKLSKLPPILGTNAMRLVAYGETVDMYVEKVLKPELMGSVHRERKSMVNILHDKFKVYQDIIKKQRAELFSEQYISNVGKELLKHSGEELPNFLYSSLLKKFIGEKLIQLWEITEKLINECFRSTNNVLSKAANDSYNNNVLLSKLMNLFRHNTESCINESKATVHNQLKALLELDQYDPYTVNKYYMDLISKYEKPALEKNATKTTTDPIIKLVILGSDDDDELIFRALSTDDQAVKQMLISIYSYWTMLTKRFMDYVTLSIRAKFVFDLCPNIKQRLKQVSIEQPDLIDTYLADDGFIRRQRQHYTDMKVNLETAYAILCEDDKTIIGKNYTCNDLTPMKNNIPTTFDGYSLEIRAAGENDDIVSHVGSSNIFLTSRSNVNEEPFDVTNRQPIPNTPKSDEAKPTETPSLFGSGIPIFITPTKKK